MLPGYNSGLLEYPVFRFFDFPEVEFVADDQGGQILGHINTAVIRLAGFGNQFPGRCLWWDDMRVNG